MRFTLTLLPSQGLWCGLIAAALLAVIFAVQAAPAQGQNARGEVRPFPLKELCERYQEAFDKKREGLKPHPNFNDALAHRRLGERYCNTGFTRAGQQVLQCALELVNEKVPALGEGRRAPRPKPICLEKAQILMQRNLEAQQEGQ